MQSLFETNETAMNLVDKITELAQHGKRAEVIVKAVVDKYAAELDQFIEAAESYLNEIRDGKRSGFADDDLQRMCLRLPVLLYRVSDGLDRASIESDLAKAAVEAVRAQHYLNAPDGTIPERKAYADLKTAEDAAVVDLTKHVHARLKSKIEFGNALFDAIRKVMSARDTDKTTFGKEMKR